MDGTISQQNWRVSTPGVNVMYFHKTVNNPQRKQKHRACSFVSPGETVPHAFGEYIGSDMPLFCLGGGGHKPFFLLAPAKKGVPEFLHGCYMASGGSPIPLKAGGGGDLLPYKIVECGR